MDDARCRVEVWPWYQVSALPLPLVSSHISGIIQDLAARITITHTFQARDSCHRIKPIKKAAFRLIPPEFGTVCSFEASVNNHVIKAALKPTIQPGELLPRNQEIKVDLDTQLFSDVCQNQNISNLTSSLILPLNVDPVATSPSISTSSSLTNDDLAYLQSMHSGLQLVAIVHNLKGDECIQLSATFLTELDIQQDAFLLVLPTLLLPYIDRNPTDTTTTWDEMNILMASRQENDMANLGVVPILFMDSYLLSVDLTVETKMPLKTITSPTHPIQCSKMVSWEIKGQQVGKNQEKASGQKTKLVLNPSQFAKSKDGTIPQPLGLDPLILLFHLDQPLSSVMPNALIESWPNNLDKGPYNRAAMLTFRPNPPPKVMDTTLLFLIDPNHLPYKNLAKSIREALNQAWITPYTKWIGSVGNNQTSQISKNNMPTPNHSLQLSFNVAVLNGSSLKPSLLWQKPKLATTKNVKQGCKDLAVLLTLWKHHPIAVNHGVSSIITATSPLDFPIHPTALVNLIESQSDLPNFQPPSRGYKTQTPIPLKCLLISGGYYSSSSCAAIIESLSTLDSSQSQSQPIPLFTIGISSNYFALREMSRTTLAINTLIYPNHQHIVHITYPTNTIQDTYTPSLTQVFIDQLNRLSHVPLQSLSLSYTNSKNQRTFNDIVQFDARFIQAPINPLPHQLCYIGDLIHAYCLWKVDKDDPIEIQSPCIELVAQYDTHLTRTYDQLMASSSLSNPIYRSNASLLWLSEQESSGGGSGDKQTQAKNNIKQAMLKQLSNTNNNNNTVSQNSLKSVLISDQRLTLDSHSSCPLPTSSTTIHQLAMTEHLFDLEELDSEDHQSSHQIQNLAITFQANSTLTQWVTYPVQPLFSEQQKIHTAPAFLFLCSILPTAEFKKNSLTGPRFPEFEEAMDTNLLAFHYTNPIGQYGVISTSHNSTGSIQQYTIPFLLKFQHIRTVPDSLIIDDTIRPLTQHSIIWTYLGHREYHQASSHTTPKSRQVLHVRPSWEIHTHDLFSPLQNDLDLTSTSPALPLPDQPLVQPAITLLPLTPIDFRQFNAMLNKLTMDNFEVIQAQLVELVQTREMTGQGLKSLAQVFFEKPLLQPNFSAMYADLAVVLDRQMVKCQINMNNNEERKITFKQMIIELAGNYFDEMMCILQPVTNVAQMVQNTEQVAQNETQNETDLTDKKKHIVPSKVTETGPIPADLSFLNDEDMLLRLKYKWIGNVTWIGILFQKDVVYTLFVTDVIQKLISTHQMTEPDSNLSEHSTHHTLSLSWRRSNVLELLVILIQTVGQKLDTLNEKAALDHVFCYFEKLTSEKNKYSKNGNFSKTKEISQNGKNFSKDKESSSNMLIGDDYQSSKVYYLVMNLIEFKNNHWIQRERQVQAVPKKIEQIRKDVQIEARQKAKLISSPILSKGNPSTSISNSLNRKSLPYGRTQNTQNSNGTNRGKHISYLNKNISTPPLNRLATPPSPISNMIMINNQVNIQLAPSSQKTWQNMTQDTPPSSIHDKLPATPYTDSMDIVDATDLLDPVPMVDHDWPVVEMTLVELLNGYLTHFDGYESNCLLSPILDLIHTHHQSQIKVSILEKIILIALEWHPTKAQPIAHLSNWILDQVNLSEKNSNNKTLLIHRCHWLDACHLVVPQLADITLDAPCCIHFFSMFFAHTIQRQMIDAIQFHQLLSPYTTDTLKIVITTTKYILQSYLDKEETSVAYQQFSKIWEINGIPLHTYLLHTPDQPLSRSLEQDLALIQRVLISSANR